LEIVKQGDGRWRYGAKVFATEAEARAFEARWLKAKDQRPTYSKKNSPEGMRSAASSSAMTAKTDTGILKFAIGTAVIIGLAAAFYSGQKGYGALIIVFAIGLYFVKNIIKINFSKDINSTNTPIPEVIKNDSEYDKIPESSSALLAIDHHANMYASRSFEGWKSISEPTVSSHNANSYSSNLPVPKESSHHIFSTNISVAGTQYRKDDALMFARSDRQRLLLQRELGNKFDKNAIRVIGLSGSSEYFIGYVPKNLATQIIGSKMLDFITARIRSVFIGKNNFLDIEFDIIGSKENKKIFKAYLNNRPVDSEQKDYLKFFAIPIAKGLTTEQAKKIISDHKNTSRPEEQEEWEGYTNIFQEFDDENFRDDYDLKKVSRSILLEAINQLKAQGNNYKYLSDHIDNIVDKIIEINPELEKKS
jgi:hypothetical protein